MFILRTVYSDSSVRNISLGESYQIIRNVIQDHPSEPTNRAITKFEKFINEQTTYNGILPHGGVEGTIGVLLSDDNPNDTKIIYLYECNQHYIMTESGKTFEKL